MKNMRKQNISAAVLTAAFALSVGFGSVSPAVAAEKIASQDDSDWSFQITPYVWLPGISANVRTLRDLPKGDVDADPVDLLDVLNFAAMAVGEVRWRRYGLIVDVSYISITAGDSTRGPLFSGVELDLDAFISTIVGTYRVVEEDGGDLDILAGARITGVDTQLTFKPGILAGRTAGKSKTWADPVFGARGQLRFGDGYFLNLYGDVGFFGVSSDLTWQAYGGLGYQVNDWFSAEAGYRYLLEDFDDDGFIYDVALHGPLVGFTFRF